MTRPSTIQVMQRAAAVVAERDRLRRVRDESAATATQAAAREQMLDQVAALYRVVTEKSLAASFAAVEDLVSEGLATVYGDNCLRFHLTPVHKRGSFSVEPVTENTREQVTGPTEDTFGGAVVQIETFLVRVVFLLQMRLVPVIVLDESFNCVSAVYLQNLATLLRDLCHRFRLDLLLVTHQQEMIDLADKVFRLVDRHDGKGAVLA